MSVSSSRLGRGIVVSCVVSLGLTFAPTVASADNVTVAYDNARTSWDPNEPGLAPAAVSASDFGRLFSTAVDGQVYAQPIIAADTLVAATEANNVYGMDPATGAVRWSRNLGPAWPSAEISCGDLVPTIGITATPVYDPATNAVYLTSKVNDGPNGQQPSWYMHSLDVTTGNERPGWPVTIEGAPSNDPTHPFNPYTAMQRPGLLLMDGVVYAGFASHCDHGPYVGYVLGVDTAAARISSLWATATGGWGEAGIWQSGGGLVSDGPGQILFTTGNGQSPVAGPGNRPPASLGEAVVRLQVQADGSLKSTDYFSPVNNTKLNVDDVDFGSGGPMALPDGLGSAAHPDLLVQIGKDGRLFLLDRNNLGGTGQGPNTTDAVVSTAGPYNGVWGHPAYWGGDDGKYVYTVESNGFLRASQLTVDAAGTPILVSAGTSPEIFGYTSGSPMVTSTGNTAGSALVWVVRSSNASGDAGQLMAYDAVPQNGVLKLRFSAAIGTAAKFVTAATDDGRVYVGTRDGHVLGFGRPATSALTGALVSFGSVAVGATATADLTVTATRPTEVTGVTTTAPFTVNLPASATLEAGQSLTVPVTFAPTSAGSAGGAVTFATSNGEIAFDVNGVGTQIGLAANPGTLKFGTLPTGANKTLSVSIVNTGDAPTEITQTSAAVIGAYTAILPKVGTVIPAGASVAASVAFAPTEAGVQDISLTVTSTGGSVTVPITGAATTGTAHLTLDPNPLWFGAVLVGQPTTRSFDILNTGNVNLTITKAKAPAGAFSTSTPVSEGQLVTPEDEIKQEVTVTPTTTGPISATYLLTSDDGQGVQTVNMNAVGVLEGNIVGAPSARCIDVAGGGSADGTPIQLFDCNGTPAQTWTPGADSSLQANGKCLDITAGQAAAGTGLQLYTCNGTPAQQWTTQADGLIVNPPSGRCIDASNRGTASGTRLILWNCHGNSNQIWLKPGTA